MTSPNTNKAGERTQWKVKFGTSTNIYYTPWHFEQFIRALELNGTQFTTETPLTTQP